MSGAIPYTIKQGRLERADGDEKLAEGTLRTEDEVIKELYAKDSPSLYKALRHCEIIIAWCRIAVGVVVGHDDGPRPVARRLAVHFARMHWRLGDCPL